MENWNIKEETGKQYVYVSKLGDDTLAKGFFGYADVWQSDTAGYSYVTGSTRRDSVSSVNSSYKQFKCIKAHTKIATTPNADAVNWAYDTDCYQEYLSTATYPLSGKTVYGNEHYVCLSGGTTGTFDASKWTKVIISNKDVPWLTIATIITMVNVNTGYNATRFVSSELFDTINNKAYHTIHILLGLGQWNETLSTSTKIIRCVGLSNKKSKLNTGYHRGLFLDNLYLMNINTYGTIVRLNNCIIDIHAQIFDNSTVSFCYNNIFVIQPYQAAAPCTMNHLVKNTFLTNFASTTLNHYAPVLTSASIIKNNYFGGTFSFVSTSPMSPNNCDYNRHVGNVYITNVAKTNISDLRAATPNQNLNSDFIVSQTFNSDYSLTSDASLLYRTGQYMQNIGATSIGFKQDESNCLLVANGATYKNIVLNSTVLSRAQINKSVVSATTNTIILETSASTIDNEYDGFRIKIITGTGGGQTRTLTGYTGINKTASVTSGWTITPDSTSVYDILDGEVTSAKIDLGGVKRIKSANFFANFISDVNGKYVEVADMDVTDGALQPKLTFEMNYSTDDSTYSGYKKFLIDEPLRIDSNGYGNGDGIFVRANQLDGTLNIRYCYIKIGLREI